MDISFKYTCGIVNVEQSFHIEFADNERVDMTKWIIDKATQLEQAGMQPAVVKQPKGLGSPIARAHGATGMHPDDLTPALDSNSRQRMCPHCGQPLYFFEGISHKGQNKGNHWRRVSHDNSQGLKCEYKEWGD
jgi:hypothetical protein